MELVTLNQNHEPVVSGRLLHKELGVKTRFSQWVEQNFKLFNEGEDFSPVVTTTPQNQHGGTQEVQDFAIKLDMAKHLAMISKTQKGREVRNYFIQVEKDYNSPDKIMARALNIANTRLSILETTVEKMKPKALFADAVAASKTSILVGELAKILRQNHVEIGQNRLYEYLRSNGYLHRGGSSRNLPTQRSMEMGLFEIKETTHTNPDGTVLITKTTKVTGKGQQYFINKFLA
jgi:anti-repressor protein